MIREVILLPTGEVADTPSGGGQTSRDPGSSPYPGSNSPEMTLAEVWSDDDVDSYWYMSPHKNLGGVGLALAAFAPPPTLVVIRSVKLQAWWTYSQGGPNNWYFPADNAYGPRARLAVRNRAKSGNNYGSWHEIAGDEIDDHNENINTGNGGYTGPLLQEWEMDAHPEGGPWTIDDLSVANFAAGIEVEADGPAFDNSQGSFFKIRVHKLQVLLTVEDLGGYVKNIRHAASLALRLMRRARNVVTLRSLADRAVADLGGRVYLSHPTDGPAVGTAGWGERRLERRAGLVTRRTIYPGEVRVEDEVFDLQAYRCLLWAAYRIDAPWSPELQGLAYLDKGGDFTHTRAQDGWSPRPGDGVLMRVLEDYPNLSTEGLACQGGGDVAVCLRNYDLMQSGWSTVGNAGDFAATAEPTVTMVEEQGYISSCRLAYGAGGGAGGRERSLGSLGAGRLHVRVILKNTSVPDPETQWGEWYLRRGTDYWNDATRTWGGTPAYNAIPSDEAYGEAVADAIPVTAATYHVGVGRFSSQMGPVTLHGALVDVQHTDDTVAGARTPLVTLDATVTREADIHRVANGSTSSTEVWSHARGVAVVEVRPFWRAADLAADAVKPLLHAYHTHGTWDAIQFVAKTGSSDLVRFERVLPTYTFQLDCPVADVDLTRAHVLRAWARWLGADGWTEYGPYSVEVGYAVFLEADGSLVSGGSLVGRLTNYDVISNRMWLGVGNDHTGRYADAYVRMLEVRRNPISGLEAVWKL